MELSFLFYFILFLFFLNKKENELSIDSSNSFIVIVSKFPLRIGLLFYRY